LIAKRSGIINLDLSYLIASASWQPVYDIRAKDVNNPIEFNYKAKVFQNTGKDWKNIKLTLSTGNPFLNLNKPELYAWNLNFYQPYYDVTKVRGGRAAKVEYNIEDLPERNVTSSIALQAGVTQEVVIAQQLENQISTDFEITIPYDVASGNKPQTVEIKTTQVNADYEYFAVPKLDKEAFLTAKISDWENLNLINGEANIYFENRFIGNININPKYAADTLTFSLGRDKRIVIEREQLKEFSESKFLSKNVEKSFAYQIKIKNTKSTPINILIEDQIPISNNEDIEIEAKDFGGAQFNKETGKLIWKLKLNSSESSNKKFTYSVTYPKDKIISGL